MVSRSLGVCLAIAAFALTGCELVVDDGTRVLASTDAGADARADAADPPPADARLPEAAPPEASPMEAAPVEASTGPSCSSECLSEATSCQQTCATSEASCMSACHPPGPGLCQQQCTQVDTTCNSGCSDQCLTCFMKASCAGSSACPK
jgi:hypothetical protein